VCTLVAQSVGQSTDTMLAKATEEWLA